ncbi:MAG: protein kinase [candidate division Zixibacteria bacterium]|nr:protein kinase [candidate division Zixibacteria bacterium]
MIGKVISHYKILMELGRGGMGTVYKAQDTKLDRFVALKFLPPHLIQDEENKKRFIYEAKAASALDHPNICTTYEIDETEDGQMFIAMAYYEGVTLKDKIERGPLGIEEILDLTMQIASGLAKAHAEGIIHRDIKPANILVTEVGVVKIVDFGLAKGAGRTMLTQTGTALGTVAYMSPEQTQGTEVDHRADIWSFGVVFYQLLTGQQPFKGDYEQAVIYSIMNEDPEPITGLRSDVPKKLEQIVNKSLVKSPDERYQDIDEILVDLKSLREEVQSDKSTKSPETREEESLPGLAVLPFGNMRSDPETDFLGFALADQIIGALTYLQNILVRPSSAIRPYQNQIVDAPTAGRDLQVDFILSGNYLKEAELVRLNIELVNVHTNEMVWREPIEVEYENAFKLQDIVSEKVIDGLKVKFSQDERARMQVDIPEDPLAYEYYLRGISSPSTTEGDQLAIEMLNKSIQLDPHYAPAYSELGSRTQRLGNLAINYELHEERIDEAEQAYLKALSLNNELLSALLYLSMLYTETGRTEKAFDLARQMLQINPNNALGYFSLGYVYKYAGMLKESEREFDKALALDPKNRRFRSAGLTYFYLGKYEKAIVAFELDPDSNLCVYYKGEISLRQNQPQRATEYFNRVIAMEPEGHYGLKTKGKMAFLEGDTKKGLRFTRKWEQLMPCDGEDWFNLAENYGLGGNKAGCARALRKAIEVGFFNYPFMLKDSFLDPVRDDPKVQRVLEMAKTKHEAFKKDFFQS